MEKTRISLGEYYLRMFFPPRCICCDTLLSIDTPREICDDCLENLPLLKRYEYHNPVGESVEEIFSAFDYEGGIRKAIHSLKFNDKPSNAALLIRLSYPVLEKYLSEGNPLFPQMTKYDIIIPVPIHSGRRRQRGYNQSEILALCLARHMSIPMCGKVLVKKVNTPPQSTLDRRERFRNLAGAFQVKNTELVRGKRILLVDDVMTTGSTLEQCGRVLLTSGAMRVDGFVVAIRRKMRIA